MKILLNFIIVISAIIIFETTQKVTAENEEDMEDIHLLSDENSSQQLEFEKGFLDSELFFSEIFHTFWIIMSVLLIFFTIIIFLLMWLYNTTNSDSDQQKVHSGTSLAKALPVDKMIQTANEDTKNIAIYEARMYKNNNQQIWKIQKSWFFLKEE